eukprot:1161470-Pelagomonas_calceolata.AAC.1
MRRCATANGGMAEMQKSLTLPHIMLSHGKGGMIRDRRGGEGPGMSMGAKWRSAADAAQAAGGLGAPKGSSSDAHKVEASDAHPSSDTLAFDLQILSTLHVLHSTPTYISLRPVRLPGADQEVRACHQPEGGSRGGIPAGAAGCSPAHQALRVLGHEASRQAETPGGLEDSNRPSLPLMHEVSLHTLLRQPRTCSKYP